MKKSLTAITLLAVILLSSCAHDKTINGVTYRPYGFGNELECKNDSIYYEVPTRVIVSTVIFSETLFVPIYNLGWNFWEAKGPKQYNGQKGVVN